MNSHLKSRLFRKNHGPEHVRHGVPGTMARELQTFLNQAIGKEMAKGRDPQEVRTATRRNLTGLAEFLASPECNLGGMAKAVEVTKETLIEEILQAGAAFQYRSEWGRVYQVFEKHYGEHVEREILEFMGKIDTDFRILIDASKFYSRKKFPPDTNDILYGRERKIECLTCAKTEHGFSVFGFIATDITSRDRRNTGTIMAVWFLPHDTAGKLFDYLLHGDPNIATGLWKATFPKIYQRGVRVQLCESDIKIETETGLFDAPEFKRIDDY